jgi:hypothetical protein
MSRNIDEHMKEIHATLIGMLPVDFVDQQLIGVQVVHRRGGAVGAYAGNGKLDTGDDISPGLVDTVSVPDESVVEPEE